MRVHSDEPFQFADHDAVVTEHQWPSALRRCDTYPCSVFAAVTGGRSPHN